MDSHEVTIPAVPASTRVPEVEEEPESPLEDAAVARILDEYLADLERGRPADPQRMFAEHPAIAHRLRACLTGLSLLQDGTSPGTKLATGAYPELAGYQIVREIGRGGMGIVYEAVQDSPQRHVALKVLPFAAALDPRQRLRFQNEAQAAARLRHTHIVPVYESGSAGGVHYFTMKLIEGASLLAVVAAQRRLRDSLRQSVRDAVALPTSSPLAKLPNRDPQYVREVARLMRQAAEALDHAHAIGIIHRDIKPGNLLVDDVGQLWITDFGLAAIQGSEGLTATGDILGTFRYMSPEQASARRGVVDHRSDIYALGVTMYELLTLQPAVGGDDQEQLLARLTLDDPPLPRSLNPAIDHDLETVLLKAMAKAPEERYATAQALAEDLERYLGGRPVLARRPGILARGAKWVRRHKAWTTAGVLMMLTIALLLAVSTGVIWFALRSEQRHRALADARELESRRHRYAAQMNLAMQEWQAGNVAKVLALLEQNRPATGEQDLRGFEWHHLWRLCQHARRETFDGLSGPVRAIAVAADGKLMAAGDDGGGIRAWDPATGKLRFTISPVGSAIGGLAISPDGERLAAATLNGQVRLWDVATQRLLSCDNQGNTMATAVAFSNSDDLFSTGNAHPLNSWDGRTGEFRQGHGNGIYSPNCLAVSSDGKRLATAANDRAVVLWDLSVSPPTTMVIGKHRAYVLCVAFSPRGDTFVSGSEDGQVIVWDASKRTMLKTLRRHTGAVVGVAFSPAGDRIASVSGDGSVKLWDAVTGDVVLQQGHAGEACSVAFADGGRTLLTGGEDGQVLVWDLAAPREPRILRGHQRWIRSLAFSGDSRSLVSASADGTVCLWPLADVIEPTVLRNEDRTTRPSWTAGNSVEDPDRMMGVVFAARDERVIAADYGGRLRRWNLRTPLAPIIYEPANGPLWSLAISSDGQTLAGAGYTTNAVLLWDAATGKAKSVLRGHGERVWCAVFSPDGKLVASAANDRTIRLWDVASGKERRAIALDASFPFALVWSPDGTKVAASGDDRRVRLWDAATGRKLGTIGQHPAAVRSLVFLPDGQTLASGSDDGTVRLWDLATGEERASLGVPGGSVWSIAVSPDGQALAAGDSDGTIVVWRAEGLEGTSSGL